MKILHTSDWHLGMALGTGSYGQDQRYFLEQLYELIRRENIGAVLLAGDVYDSSITNAEAIGIYNEAVTRLCLELGVKLIVIAGNHDSAARLASCRELLKSAGLYVTGRLERLAVREPGPLGTESGKRYIYIGPVEPEVREDQHIRVEGQEYLVRSAQEITGNNGPAYTWAMCVEKGREAHGL